MCYLFIDGWRNHTIHSTRNSHTTWPGGLSAGHFFPRTWMTHLATSPAIGHLAPYPVGRQLHEVPYLGRDHEIEV